MKLNAVETFTQTVNKFIPFTKKCNNGKYINYLDRGYALEKDWQRSLETRILENQEKRIENLDDWYQKAKEGKIPIPVFNSTLVENGYRFLISPMKFLPEEMADYLEQKDKNLKSSVLGFRTLYNNCGDDEKQSCNLDITTAARLSASFPYVSPSPRNDRPNKIPDPMGKCNKHSKNKKECEQNYRLADGGYFDNAGAFTALEWVDELLEQLKKDEKLNINITKVLYLQMNAFPESKLKNQKGELGWFVVTTGPLQTLNGVRESTLLARNIEQFDLLKKRWEKEGIAIEQFTISFPEKIKRAKEDKPKKIEQSLSWRLTNQEKQNLKDAWVYDKTISKEVKCMKNFWENPDYTLPECKPEKKEKI